MVKISINQKECLGCSFCMSLLPEIFQLDENEFKGKLKKGDDLVAEISLELSSEQIAKVKEAVDGCPVQAIKIEE
jgi:ferredoxin